MAVRRARFKPTANLSLKRPNSNNRPAILRASQVKSEKEDAPSTSSPVIKSEPVVVPKKEGEPKPPPSPGNPPQFLPPRPSPAPSPVQSPAPLQPSRSPAYAVARSPAHHLDDALFKSPIMSPSYPPLSRTPNPFHKPVLSPNPYAISPVESPGSPNKARHRVRAVPVLSAQRRPTGTIPGEENSPVTEEVIRIPQRVRHISTSSTTSVTKFVPQQVGRIRTESTCSAYSDVSVFKPRRAARSDEYMRLCEARRELLKKCNGEAPLKSQLRMYDMIYYNPKSNPMKRATDEEGNEIPKKDRRMSISSTLSVKEDTPMEEAAKKTDPDPPEQESAMPVPQLKLGPNGEMILDEKSLTIEMTGEREARERIANADIVYDDLHSNHGFYKRHQRTKDWSPEETIRFYRCLQVIGTDFSLMNSLFPNRSRRDLKLKFKKEEKVNGFLVNKALIEHTSFDIDELKETFRKEDELKEEERKEQQKAKEKVIEARAELAKKIKNRIIRRPSRSERATLSMDVDLEQTNVQTLRQHKPRKIQQNKPKSDDPVSLPQSPFSIPPPSPCRTPNPTGFPPSPLQTQRQTPQKPLTPNNELYYYDMNLKCATRGRRKITESDAREPIEIIAPKSVEIVQNLAEDETIQLKPIQIKVEPEETEKQKSPDGAEESSEDEDNGMDGLDLSNLVVLEGLNDKGEKTYKVHLLDTETDEMSEEPLDLPQEVIDYIVEAHQKQQASGEKEKEQT